MKLQLVAQSRPITSNDATTYVPVARGQVDRAKIDEWRNELANYYSTLVSLSRCGDSPDQIFLLISSYTARASEIRSFLVDDESRLSNAFRTKQIDPFIQECDRQFKIWSRIVSVQQTEIDLAGRII